MNGQPSLTPLAVPRYMDYYDSVTIPKLRNNDNDKSGGSSYSTYPHYSSSDLSSFFNILSYTTHHNIKNHLDLRTLFVAFIRLGTIPIKRIIEGI